MGSVAVGNLKQFLPRMIQLIESNPLRVYLLLNSLKETIEKITRAHGRLGVFHFLQRINSTMAMVSGSN